MFALLSLRGMSPCKPESWSVQQGALNLKQKDILPKLLLASQWLSQEGICLLDSPTGSPASAQVFRHSVFPYKLQPRNNFGLYRTNGKTEVK